MWAPRCRWWWRGSPPRARPSSTASITSTAATSISRRSSPPAAPISSGWSRIEGGMADPLKLRGEDEDDLAVISAVLQDALVAVGEMAYFPKEARFGLGANRFRWEPPPAGERQNLDRRLARLPLARLAAVPR